MCDKCCIEFVEKNLNPVEVAGKSILEVGSFNENGTVRTVVEAMKPARYIGVDIKQGPCVDQVCNAEDIVDRFGPASFDVVVSTEMLEHVENWKRVVHNFKLITKPGGTIVITTRSKGFPRHNYPGDYWRFEIADMQKIFSDCVVEKVEKDACSIAGVFVKAVKREPFKEEDLYGIEVYSMGHETLDEIAYRLGTDKKKDKHDFARFYDRYFQGYREKKITLMEIGISCGYSLQMWEQYFPAGQIVGIDNDPTCKARERGRIKVFIGEQTDVKFLSEVVQQIGKTDIIIDDGGHLMSQQILSFEYLFPQLANGGVYVIEDLHTSYLPGYNQKHKGKTSMEFLKDRIEDLEFNGRMEGYENHLSGVNKIALFKTKGQSMSCYEEFIESISFLNDLCFIHKR